MTTTRQIGNFQLRNELFEQVKYHMQTVLAVEVNDQLAVEFLEKRPRLLGSIVGYDEVDTGDRENIWDECKSEFAPDQWRHEK